MYGDIRPCAAIVGYADLSAGSDAGAVLDAHILASTRFRGIRHASGWDADEGIRNSHTKPTENLLSDSQFRRGFTELGARGLTFDAWMYHPQIHELTDLARTFPDQPIVFDHFGGPLGIGSYSGKREAVFADWRASVTALAQCKNVVAKLGGLIMPINGFGFHKQPRPPSSQQLADKTRDYYLTMIDLFGAERCMFESNFPVDKTSASYPVLWNSFKRITQSFSAADKASLFHDTAVRVYRVRSD